MDHNDQHQSGQTLVEYGLLIALIPLAMLTLFIPATLVYLYMRRARGADRGTALLAAFGVTLLVGLLVGGRAKALRQSANSEGDEESSEPERAKKSKKGKKSKRDKKNKRAAQAERELLISELLPYTRYVSRVLAAGGTMRDALADIVRSQPESPLTAALDRALTYGDQSSDLEEGLSQAQDEDFKKADVSTKVFFAILGTGASPTQRGPETTAALDNFFEVGLAGGFNYDIRPIEPAEIVTLKLELDPALERAIRQEDSN